MKLHTILAALATVILLVTVPKHECNAQDVMTGSFEGMVVDKVSSKPIDRASVRIINELSKFDSRLNTDWKGRFYQGLLPPGVYNIQFSAPGYQSRGVRQRVIIGRVVEFLPLPVELDPIPEPSPQTTV